MSHHIDMKFSVLPPGKEPVSKKLQQKNAESASAKKRENKMLDIDNKQMEWRLLQLKKVMAKEKEERGKQGFIWESGKNAAELESHACNTLGHSVKISSGKAKSTTAKKVSLSQKPKVKILKDEPLDLPTRKKHTKELIGKLLKEDPALLQLNANQEPPSTVSRETWISIAVSPAEEEIMEIQSDTDGNLPISCLTAIEPLAIGLYFKKWSRKRLLLAIDGKVMRPKQGWGSEVYYPYVATVSPRKTSGKMSPSKPVAPKALRNSTSPKRDGGGRLLQGTFNEEESAESFKHAVMEWRKQKPQSEMENREPKAPVEMSVHAIQSDPVAIDIQFSETSTLTYMERLLLKKHRSTDVPPLPQNSLQTTQDHDDSIPDVEMMPLTEEEMEERSRIRQLFVSPSIIDTSSDIADAVSLQSCTITELSESDEEQQQTVEESVCYVEEVRESDVTHRLSSPSQSIVNIEEVTYQEVEGNTSSSQSQVEDQTSSSAPEKINETTCNQNKQVFLEEKNGEHLNPDRRTPKRPSSAKSATTYVRRIGAKRLSSASARQSKTTDPSINLSDVQRKDSASKLISAIGNLPLNPDAYYRHGLNEFFSGGNVEPSTSPSHSTFVNNQPTQIMLCSQGNESWKPSMSLASRSPNPDTVNSTREELYGHWQDTSQDSIQASSPQEILNDVIEREEADAKTLDALEWELASQKGNITEDGRISRLIDEWSSDDELGIINDPGLGSGLSTPEREHSGLSSPQLSNIPQRAESLHQDFMQMEQLMLGDLSSADDMSSEDDLS